jgi:hypothetical protein
MAGNVNYTDIMVGRMREVYTDNPTRESVEFLVGLSVYTSRIRPTIISV